MKLNQSKYNKVIKVLKQSIKFASKDKKRLNINSVYYDEGKIATTDGKVLFIHPIEIQFTDKISFDIEDLKKLERTTVENNRIIEKSDFVIFNRKKVRIYNDRRFRFQLIEEKKIIAQIKVHWERIEQCNKEILVLFDSEGRKIELLTKVFKKFFNKNFTFENCENYAIKGTFRDTCIFMSRMR